MLHIYIVSLKQDIEKREVISKTLKSFGLEFSFLDAIYGKSLPDSSLSSFRNKSKGKIADRDFSATPGEIGCTLSHLKAYQNMIDNNLNWACILEDDVILDERFKVFIESFQDVGLNKKALHMLGGQNGFPDFQVIKSKKNNIMIGKQKFYKTIKSEQFIYRTCCYLISSKTADKLLKLSEDIFILADDWDYLVKNRVIHEIYLANFVDHPTDLSSSHIQEERDVAQKNYISSCKKRKIPILSRVEMSIKWRFRLLFLNCYKHVEVKDKLL